MSAHDEYMTKRQARDLARRLARLERKTRSTAAAHADLRHSSVDGGVFKIKDAEGNTAYELGTDPATGVTAPQFKGGPVPEQPAAAFVDVGPRVIKVQSSGLDVNEDPAPADFKHAEVHVSQDATFEPSLSTFATNLDAANGSVTHSLPAGEWWVGIVWVTLSGQRSPMSEPVLADIEPPVDVQDIQDTLDAAETMLDEYAAEVAAPRFDALEEGFETHETNIADARDRITAAENTLSPLPGRITEAETKVEAAKEAAESAEARAVEASNNASNRLTNGGFELGLDHWDTTNVTLSNDAHTGTQAALIGAGGSLVPDASIPVSDGDVWDVSAYAKNGSALVVDVINSADNTVLESFTTSTASSWSETGRLRVEVPSDVSYVNIRITGDGVLVDDVVLRDVTDVVRLERAATQARLAAEQAIAELAILQLAVDGEGGLKDRLASAETVLETKADESALDQLDQKLAGNLAAFEAHYTRVWRQDSPPPPGTHYEWLGEPHASHPVMLDENGVEIARNLFGYQYSHHSNAGYNARGWTSAVVAIEPNTTYTITIRNKQTNRFSLWQDPLENGILAPMTHPSGRVSLINRDYYNTAPGDDIVHTVTTLDFGGYLVMYLSNEGPNERQDLIMVEQTDEPTLYFDGGTASDRANDLWYNADGVPHEWVNGEGWVELSDARITELANTVNAHATRLADAETELGKKATTSALNALAGTVADNQTAIGEAQQTLEDAQADLDTALTGPVTHDRLRAGTGAFNQAFIARLVADSVQAMSAEFANLTVTEKANFAQIIGDQIWAELAVFQRLDAREAYIGGAHLKDGAVTAEKMTITGDLAAAIISADKARIAELISDEIWAELGVFDRLEAREGWIGGTNLADGAITAEKITATRELITKIMGAEWAYISERLIVEGDLIANHADIISAAIKNLSVTERADLFEAFITTLGAQEAVIDLLIGTEAWIGGTMLKDDTVTTRNIVFTEELVGNIASLLHLVVGEINVNELWADQTWQAAGHFGSSSADQSTLVDGTGLRITKHDQENETSTDIVRLGGEGIGLTFFDEETGEVTGSQSPEGDASYRDVSVGRLTINGRQLLPETDPAEFWDGNLWDSQPKGLLCFHEEDMRGQSINHAAYGFIEVSHHVRANRRYRVSISNVRLTGSGTYYGHFKYTLGDQPSAPHTESPQLGQSWFLRNTATSGVSAINDHVFTPEHDGLIRILFVVEGESAGIEFAGISGYNQVQMRLEDLGPNRPYTGMGRVAGHGGSGTIRDPKPLTGAVTTEWEMTWFQNYSHGGTRRRSASNNRYGYGAAGLTQGRRQDLLSEGIWSSLFGFNASTSSTNPTDENVTLPAALNGAEIISMHLEVVNHYAWHPNGATRYGFGYHAHPPESYPSQYGGTTSLVGDQRLVVGATARIPIPFNLVEQEARNGGLKGFSINTGATGHTYAGQISWDNRPKLVVTYKR